MGWLARVRDAMGIPREKRQYEAAVQGRNTYGWRSPSTSANAEIQKAGNLLRDRSRDLVRNNPLAHKALSVLSTSIVGESGIMPRWGGVADEGLRQAAKELWDRWSRGCDTTGRMSLQAVQWLAVHGMLESGDALVRRRLLPNPSGVRLRLQLMEPDWLDETNQPIGDSLQSILGVVVDADGLVVGYRIRDTHPGDTATWSLGRIESQTVPAAYVTHLYNPTRPGQLRGAPHLSPVATTLKMLHDHEVTELVRCEVQATLAMIVRGGAPPTASSMTDPGNPDGMGLVVQDSDGRTVETVERGGIFYANGAEGIEMTKPGIDAAFPMIMKHYERKVAAGLSMLESQLTADLSGINYSSFRAGQLDFRAEMMRIRNQAVIPFLCDPLWDWFRASAAAADPRMLDLPETMRWTNPKWQSVEPQKDVTAATSRVAGGFNSLSAETEDMGHDPEEVATQLGRDKQMFDSAGISVDTLQSAAAQSAAAEAVPV